MEKIKELLSKSLKGLESVYKHMIFLPLLFLLMGGLIHPASSFVGGMFFGAMGVEIFKIIYKLKKKVD